MANRQEIIRYFLANLVGIVNLWVAVAIVDTTIEVEVIVFVAKVAVVAVIVEMLKLNHLELNKPKKLVIMVPIIPIMNWLLFVITVEMQNLRFIKVKTK